MAIISLENQHSQPTDEVKAIAEVDEYREHVPEHLEVPGLNLESHERQGFYKLTYVDARNSKIAHRSVSMSAPDAVFDGLVMYNNYSVLREEGLPLPATYDPVVVQDSVPAVWIVGDFNESLVSLDHLEDSERYSRENEILDIGLSIRDLMEEGRVAYGEPIGDLDSPEFLENIVGYDVGTDSFVIKDIGELPSDATLEGSKVPAGSREEFLDDNNLREIAERILSDGEQSSSPEGFTQASSEDPLSP